MAKSSESESETIESLVITFEKYWEYFSSGIPEGLEFDEVCVCVCVYMHACIQYLRSGILEGMEFDEVCVCVCVHVYRHTYIHKYNRLPQGLGVNQVCVCVCVHAYNISGASYQKDWNVMECICVCVCTCIHTCTHTIFQINGTNKQILPRKYIYIHIHTCSQMARSHASQADTTLQVYTHAYIHTYIYIHTYTYTNIHAVEWQDLRQAKQILPCKYIHIHGVECCGRNKRDNQD
jgi:hypothetical protein